MSSDIIATYVLVQSDFFITNIKKHNFIAYPKNTILDIFLKYYQLTKNIIKKIQISIVKYEICLDFVTKMPLK